MKVFLLLLLLVLGTGIFGQAYVTRDITSFGAKGDGKTNDHNAFRKAAAFFNARGGQGKLVIPKGVYIVGEQRFNRTNQKEPVYTGENLLDFKNVSHLTVEGVSQPVIRYRNELRFGTFDPKTGRSLDRGKNFFDHGYSATIKNAIELTNCSNVVISSLEIDGNSDNIVLGGTWGDVGRQLPHTGIWMNDSRAVTVTNVYVHHFGLDGIVISNATGNSRVKDSIKITESRFEYNSRQGLSWVGGNDLTVINSTFNHTGRGKFASAPGAGVDIEAEVGPVKNGNFINCQFINNSGPGLVADSGPSSHCTFTDCTFWGVTTWSIWVKKPAYTFLNSKIYGAVVHGFDSQNEIDATKFISCHFEDKPYNKVEPYGRFLVETNETKRMLFENCSFVANKKKLLWMSGRSDVKPEDRYRLINCHFKFLGGEYPVDDWFAVIRGTQIKNCTFEIRHKQAANFYINGLEGTGNINLGGNKMVINNITKKI